MTTITCPDCGGSGLKADTADYTAEEREMLDSTRCFACCGDGQVDDVDYAALQNARTPPEGPENAA